MKQAVIFDLDGTLVNSLPDIAAAMNRSLRRFGLPEWPEDAYKFKVGNGVFRLTERAVGEHTGQTEAVLRTYMADYAENCRVNSYAYPGLNELLLALNQRGVLSCVLSNKDQGDVESVIRYYFPQIEFAALRGRVDGVPLKPDPAGALLIAKDLGLSPDDFLYVGDTGTDMACGAAAGMETVGVLWGFRPREELTAAGARRLIAEPGELLSLLD